MKKKNDMTVGGALSLTVLFAIMAIFSYTSDKEGNPIAVIPVVGVVVSLIMALNALIKSEAKEERKKQQDKFAKTVDFDDSFGNEDLKLYFNSNKQEVVICATTDGGNDTKVVSGFGVACSVKTDDYIVSFDAMRHKVLRIKSRKGTITYKEYDFGDELKNMGVTLRNSIPALKAYNNYAFITDDVNGYVVIVTSSSMHVYLYSDIVSISYEENGNDMYNKSIGGAVVGGLLFGGVGAIVGSNAAKTIKNKKIEMMSIKILLKNTANPTIMLKIYKAGADGGILETKNPADRIYYEGLMKEVSGIRDMFSVILDIVNRDNICKSSKEHSATPSTRTVADELIKLMKLKDAGALSEEEFQQQKTKLLN